jgi:glycosyltransferase involved in cell wall biosynthesis
MKLLFIDPKCPRPYDPEVLASQGLGGTEATVVRIAGELAKAHEVRVIQHNRQTAFEVDARLAYLPPTELARHAAEADHVIFIQKAQGLSSLRTRGRLWLWLHNYVADEVPFFWQDHLRHRLGIICVSQTHALHTQAHIRSRPHAWLSAGLALRGGLLYHHNPLAPGIERRSEQAYDPNKLVFFSSPYKGIEQVLRVFKLAHERHPTLKLHVADPGYIRNFDPAALEHPGIVRLGSLPQTEVLRHVREALCVFYPQSRRAETFGLVYAEANAVGTPVLAHDFGAAREVLVAANPPIDARDDANVLATLDRWLAGQRPVVDSDPRFVLDRVAAGWNRFLSDPAAFVREQGLARLGARS